MGCYANHHLLTRNVEAGSYVGVGAVIAQID